VSDLIVGIRYNVVLSQKPALLLQNRSFPDLPDAL
jgi:hypothetical protein